MSALGETFAPLKNRTLRIYFSGQVVSLIGTWMQQTAQQWLVWELTGSEAQLGTIAMLGTLPLLLLGPLAGSLSDRWDRRRILIATQAVAAGLAVTLAGLVQFDLVQIWHVYGLALALGIVGALDLPAQQAILGDMTGPLVIRKAIVLNGMIVNISRVLGPAMAGWLVQRIGTAPAFFFNGVSFLAVIASLLIIRVVQVRKSGGEGGGKFQEGIRYLRTRPRILDMMMFTGMITFFGFSTFTLLPSFVSKQLAGNADTYGTLLAMSGVGGLFSTIFVVAQAQRIRRAGALLAGCVAVAGVGFMLISQTRSLASAVLAFLIPSIIFPIVMTTANGLIQFLSPPEMRGRILAIYLMIAFGLQPIAAQLVGWMGQTMGAPTAILINGMMMTGMALLGLMRPGLATWEPVPAGGGAGQAPAVGGAPAAQ